MMNKNKSNRNSLMRYALLLPVAGLLIISGNVQAVISKVRTELTQNPTKQQVNETVSGIVVTSDDKPLMGANIIIKGTHNGTISDKEGRFSLPMEPGQQLHISYVGMKTVLITPKPNQKDLKVMMVDEPVYQEELVVVGYGEQKKLPAAAQKENSKEDPIFTVVEDMPSFPGGEQALMQYLAKNIKYPVIAQENGIEGRVIVAYIVGADGKITSPEIVRGVDPALDKEALRIVENMPVWKPGKQRGKAVAVRYVLPITFRLQGKGDGAATPATKK